MKKIFSKELWSFWLGFVLLMAKLLMSEVVVPISQVSSLTLDWLIPNVLGHFTGLVSYEIAINEML